MPHQYFFASNYFELLLVLSSLQKSEILELTISFFHYFWCQNWDHWHKMSGKTIHIYFFYFWFKNKWVWVEKITKFELSGQFCFFRHPWGSWGRQSSGLKQEIANSVTVGQKYKNIFVHFLEQMKTLKSPFEINWPLV